MNKSEFPRNLLTTKPTIWFKSFFGSIILVPKICAITPPLSISPINITGTFAAVAKPILAISFFLKFISAGDPAPSTRIKSYFFLSLLKLCKTGFNNSFFKFEYSYEFIVL